MTRALTAHQLDTGGGFSDLAFCHNQAALRSVTFNATDYGMTRGRVLVSVPAPEQTYFVQFSLAGSSQITYHSKSIELVPGYVCVLSAHLPFREMFDGNYKHFTVKVPWANLESILAQELGFKPRHLEFAPDPVPIRGAAEGFARLVRIVCDDLNAGGSTYIHPRVCGAVEETLARLLLSAVPHNYSDLFNSSPAAAAPYYVRRVEEYIRAHANDFVSLADMVQVSGVSARSLHLGFRRFRNNTPMGYLKNHRLEMARRMLASGIEQGMTVTEIALTCGFTHLSKFARDYYERYNERPSATLRGMRGHNHGR
jgi:AraC-like DNA-binding protein